MKHYRLISFCLLAAIGFSSCIQREIHDAFMQVNEGLTMSNKTIEERNDSLYAVIQNNTGSEALKAKTTTARNNIRDYTGFIDSLKKEMVKRAGGYDENGDMVRRDDIDITGAMMIDEKKGDTLFAKMTALKVNLLAATTDSAATANIKGLLTPKQPSKETLVKHYFYHVPVTAAVTILTKLKNDAVSVGEELYNGVLREMDDHVNIVSLAPDIEIKLKNDFGDKYLEVTSTINKFCSSRKYLYQARIIRCIIYLAEKRPDKIQHYLQAAAGDPRDVMLWAEYIQSKGEEPKRVRDFNKSFAENSIK